MMISIRRRLTLLLCLAVGSLLVGTGLGVFIAMHGLLEHQFDETLRAKASALITASEIDDGDFEIDLTVQNFAGFGTGGEDYFEIRRLSDQLFLRSPSLENGAFRISSDSRVAPPHDDLARIFAARLGDGRRARFYVQTFYPKDDKKKRFQNLYLIVASPTSGMHFQLALLATVLTIAGAAALILMVPLIRLGLRRGLKPLHQLADDVEAIHPGNLHQRLSLSQMPSELAPVAHGLNDWLTRLESSFDRERRFSSHAAHELRTPLAEIRSLAELGTLFPEEATPQRCAEIVKVSDEMQALLEKLSLLARADSGRQPIHREILPLGPSIQAQLQRFQPLAEKREMSLATRITEGPFNTDPVLWSTILQNLIGNALAHAPQGTDLQIDASPHHFRISNPAPGWDATDFEHVFERFWQKDAAHTRTGHSGLGMSIVRACVHLLGGTVSARPSPDGRFETEILWPSEAPETRSEMSIDSPRPGQ
ncbi:signal transduction histidine kinase [Haloferula luteola]|uniref:histidine kinase n=1 Tax=Haloferula luteola TaxID=595692 RepID=A0A840V956_9BACT|nr:ATP-binding protein [Haloferula luteola]MBB5352124.1 signal transduction histidine kinase [Haloferula luteola]